MTPLPVSSEPALDTEADSTVEQKIRSRLWGRRFWLGSAVILLGLYGGRSWLNERRAQTPQQEQAATAINYDAYSNGVTSVLYDSDGNIQYTLEATEQVHYLDNTTQLQNPYVRLYQGSGARWNIVARSGRIHAAEKSEKITRLDLSEDVELYQIDDAGNRITLETSFLSLFPETETMSTEREVTMTTNTLRQTATGMRADLQQDTLTFLAQVKGRYEVHSSQP